MWRAGNSSTWRAVLVAWGLILICASPALIAAQLNPAGSVDHASRPAEPFGLATTMVAKGPVLEKWFGVEREVDDGRRVLKICEQNRTSCQSQTALQFLAIVESGRNLDGRARLGEINLAIRPMSALALYGV